MKSLRYSIGIFLMGLGWLVLLPKALVQYSFGVSVEYNGANIYPISLEKITRMYRGAIDKGFASFAEA